MPRRRARRADVDVEALEQQYGRPSARRVTADIPPEIIAAMDARLDAEAEAWRQDFDAVLARVFRA